MSPELIKDVEEFLTQMKDESYFISLEQAFEALKARFHAARSYETCKYDRE